MVIFWADQSDQWHKPKESPQQHEAPLGKSLRCPHPPLEPCLLWNLLMDLPRYLLRSLLWMQPQPCSRHRKNSWLSSSPFSGNIYICENILDDDIVRECGERPNSRDGIKDMKTHYSFNNGDNERTMTEWTYYHYRDWLSFIGMV